MSSPSANETTQITAYADGACSGNPGPAGIGIVVLSGKGQHEKSEYLGMGTNNIAELTAILRVLEAIHDRSRPVRIHTDSRYAIGVITKGWKAKANVELVGNLRRRFVEFQDIEIQYVPGHSGIPLNERADALARQAVREQRSTGWVPAP